jgi:hypothetical protein
MLVVVVVAWRCELLRSKHVASERECTSLGGLGGKERGGIMPPPMPEGKVGEPNMPCGRGCGDGEGGGTPEPGCCWCCAAALTRRRKDEGEAKLLLSDDKWL